MKSFLEIKYDLVDKLLRRWRISNSADSEEVEHYFKYPRISGYLYAKSIKWGVKIAQEKNNHRLDIRNNFPSLPKETLGEIICKENIKIE